MKTNAIPTRADRDASSAMRVLFDTTTEGIYGIDRHGLCTMANRAAGEFLGYRPEELIGRNMHQLIHHTRSDGSPYPVEDCPIYQAMKDGHAREVDDDVLWRSDASSFSASYSSRPILDEDGPAGAVVSFRDITERKRMEIALRESASRTLSFMEYLPLGVFVVDEEGRPVYSNAVSRDLMGIEANPAFDGDQLSDAYQVYVAGTDDLYPAERLPVVRALQGEIVDVDDIEIRRPDGSVSLLEVWAGPIRGEDGTIRYGAAAFSDIRTRKEAEVATRESRKAVLLASQVAEQERQKAQEADRAKSEFLSRMSHELRTPLNGILGFSQLLEMEELEADQRDSVVQIRKAGNHLLDLINEVLDLARIEAGRLSMSLEPLMVHDLLEECVAMVTPLASERGISIRMAPNETQHDEHVLADHQRLKQVILNLLSNAIKYNRPQGSIDLEWERDPDDMVEISVSDTGPGIPAQKLDRLFIAFDRLDVPDEQEEGAGLGLALSSNLAKAMGGALEVSSERGLGSRFTVRIPRATPVDAPVPEETGAVAVSSVVGASTVLYIEDNPANVKLLERILKLRPLVTLATASHGKAGLDLAHQLRPQLVLLDVNLPDINGDVVLRRLQEDPSTADIPVIFLSADANSRQMASLMDAGAADYVTKPLDVQSFLSIVDRVLQEGARMPSDSEMEIGQISHKLINQIALVSSYAGWLKELDLPGQQKEMVDEIVTASQEAIELHRALETRIEATAGSGREATPAAENGDTPSILGYDPNEFMSRMSHELRTPLNSILGFSQLMLMDGLDAEQRDNAVQIEKNGRHLLRLIDEVLNVTQIEAGRMTLSIEPVHGVDVVREVAELLKQSSVGSGVDLTVEVPSGADGNFVRADLQRLKQVLINLVTNAIRYTGAGGKAVIRYEWDGGETVRISVTDTGPGIASADLDRLFVPFDRLGAEASNVEGSGLGLAISQKLVEAFGGKLLVASEVGRGSVFTVTLAHADEPTLAGADKAQIAPRRDGTLRRVLYIEDNLSNLKLVERVLARHDDIELTAASQGGTGLDLARHDLPDVILLDLHLPDMNGAEVLDALRQDPATAGIPVIVVSADATSAQMEKLLAMGVEAYLTKPLDLVRFQAVLEKAFTLARTQIAL